MKKRLLSVALLVLSQFAHAQWAVVGSSSFSGGGAGYLDMAFDNNNVPYLSYRDASTAMAGPSVRRFNGSSWVQVGTAGMSSDQAEYTELAFDNANTPYIVYKDGGNANKVTVRKFVSGSWTAVGPVAFSGGQVDFTNIAIDANNVVYVAYRDGANSFKSTVVKFNGSSWVTVGTAGFSSGISDYIDLVLDNNNVPYITYTDFSLSRKAVVKKFDGSAWVNVGVEGFTSATVIETKLAFDGTNVPYLAYRDGASAYKLSVSKFNGTSWVTVGAAGFSAGTADYLSLAIGSDDLPYIAYRDVANSNKASLMKFNGSSWTTITAGFSTGDAQYTSLALDATDIPYVAYSDGGTVLYSATVQRYAAPPISSSIIPSGSTAICQGQTVTLSIPAQNGVTYKWQDLSAGAGAWSNVAPAGSFGSNGSGSMISTDKNGVPYVLFLDAAYNYEPSLMSYDGSTWSYMGSPGFTPGAVGVDNTSLVFDQANVPYVAFKDATNSNKVSVMKYNGSNWVNVGAAGFSAGVVNYTHMAIDNANVLYVAYSDVANADKLTVKKFNGSAWVTVGTVGFSAGSAGYGKIIIDANNVPHVVYSDGNSSGKATAMKFNGTSWVAVGSTGFSAGSLMFLDLAFDQANALYASYMDLGNGSKATVMKFNGSNWVNVGSAGFTPNESWYLSLGIDRLDNPYVIYADQGNNYYASVKTFNGSTWQSVGSTWITSANVDYTDLIVDANDVVYIAYRDFSVIGTPITVRKFQYTYPQVGTNSNSFVASLPRCYNVVVTNSVGFTATSSNKICITVNPLPTVSAGLDQAVCSGDQATLSGAGAVSYTWDQGVVNGTPFTPSATLTYTVTGTDVNTCTNTDQVLVTVNTLPDGTAESNSPVCTGNEIVFASAGGLTYAWSGPNGFSSILQNPRISSPSSIHEGTYDVLITDANNCEITKQVVVSLLVANPDLTIVAGSNSPVCSGDAIVLTLSGGNNIAWTGPNSFTSVQQNPSILASTLVDAGDYTVKFNDVNGCGNVQQLTVVVSNCLSVLNNTDEQKITLFPNPASDFVVIKKDAGVSISKITVYDTMGKVVLTQHLAGSTSSVDVSGLAKGVYTLHVVDADQKFYFTKFLKQ
jgi:hypothetical protein